MLTGSSSPITYHQLKVHELGLGPSGCVKADDWKAGRAWDTWWKTFMKSRTKVEVLYLYKTTASSSHHLDRLRTLCRDGEQGFETLSYHCKHSVKAFWVAEGSVRQQKAMEFQMELALFGTTAQRK